MIKTSQGDIGGIHSTGQATEVDLDQIQLPCSQRRKGRDCEVKRETQARRETTFIHLRSRTKQEGSRTEMLFNWETRRIQKASSPQWENQQLGVKGNELQGQLLSPEFPRDCVSLPQEAESTLCSLDVDIKSWSLQTLEPLQTGQVWPLLGTY